MYSGESKQSEIKIKMWSESWRGENKKNLVRAREHKSVL